MSQADADAVRIVTVDAANVAQYRFFCYKSRPKAEGYRLKLDWIEDAVKGVVEIASEGGAKARRVKLESGRQVQDSASSAHGLFNVVYDGKLVTYHYIDSRKGREKFLRLLER
ncbi:MAG: hypothetical protein SVX38_12825 [Chloroflexota bacterium]|nr:hypothetical protein [Chloroflexota bacterium]